MIVKPVDIPTPDGTADGYALYPSEEGRYPAVLFYMDAIGVRPALIDLAKGVAEQGYYVLLPNLFYRNGKAPVLDSQRMLSGEGGDEIRDQMMKILGAITTDMIQRDATAYVNFIEQAPRARHDKIATTGYCMGGGWALRTAAWFPEKVAAAASFHGGRLATDEPDSPHLLAPKIKAELYLGHAINDHSCPQEQVDRLEEALNKAGVKHQTEMYDAAHGWTMPDLPWASNKPEEAKKAWQRLYELLDRTLKQPAGAR